MSTYMPRNISVMRKYFPTLSNVLSFSWSHSVGGFRRKFLGGGPAGVAYVLLATKACNGIAQIATEGTRARGIWRAAIETADFAIIVKLFWVGGGGKMARRGGGSGREAIGVVNVAHTFRAHLICAEEANAEK